MAVAGPAGMAVAGPADHADGYNPSARYGAAKATGCSIPGLSGGGLGPPFGGVESAPAEDLERQRDCADSADQEECPPHGPALNVAEAVSQQQADAGAEGRASPGHQSEFWKCDCRVSHGYVLSVTALTHDRTSLQ
jgi:hypothetical protein